MTAAETPIPGAMLITPKLFADARGDFRETWSAARFGAAGLGHDWVQDNMSRSSAAGTVRGLHLQLSPMAQAKLVSVAAGRIFDAIVDLRRSSPSFGRWFGVELDADGGGQLLVPRGCAHGFMTLTPETIVTYKVDAPYSPQLERSIRWDDPDIGIDWPTVGAAALSDKDAAAPSLAQLLAEMDEAAR